MILIDQTAVRVGRAPDDASHRDRAAQWIVNASLAIAAFVAVGGRIGNMYGNDRVFKLGASVLSSVACGLAGSESSCSWPAPSRGSAPR